MNANEHVQTAREFLEASDREFEAGDKLQASEKLWGAATHALMAVIQAEGQTSKSHRDLRITARRLAIERNDLLIGIGFETAEKFHINFYHGFMDDWQIADGREDVHEFVKRLLPDLSPEPTRT